MKKFKDLVKQNSEPARGKSGTDPMDPWNAKSGLAEASETELLKRYLKSRGINPEFIPKDTKIAHAKSSAFLSWRKNHEFDESVEILEATDEADTLTFDIPLMIRMLELAREDVKDDMELHRITERLIEIRSKGVLTMDDYEFIAGIKKLKEEQLDELSVDKLDAYRKKADKQYRSDPNTAPMKRAVGAETADEKIKQKTGKYNPTFIDKLKSRFSEEQLTKAVNEGRMKDIATNDAEDKRLNKMSTLQKFRADAAARAKKHDAVEKNSGGMTSAIDRLEKHMNEEEQIDEVLSKDASAGDWIHDFIKSKNPKFAGKSKEERKKMALGAYYGKQNEDCSCDDKKKEWSKSARMIKALYKKKGVKEETYDWEKDDKNMQVTGKKPKLKDTPDIDNVGENKPDARAVLTGGKTMTGEKRDDVEIDPFMKKPKNNTPDDFDKPTNKKDH